MNDRRRFLLSLVAVVLVLAACEPGGTEIPPPHTETSSDDPAGNPTGASTHVSTPAPTPTDGSSARVIDLRTGEVERLPHGIADIPLDCCYGVSPDGSKIAFVGRGAEAPAFSVFVANIDGSHVRELAIDSPLSSGDPGYGTPQWSSDGTKIVYQRDDGAIVIVEVATGVATPIADGRRGEHTQPTFSPDGRTILFTRSHRQPAALGTVPAADGRESVLLEPGAYGTYSPDGTTIAYTCVGTRPVVRSYRGIWLADPDGGHPREVPGLYQGVAMGFLIGLQERSRAAWSPDGTTIAASLLDGGPVVVVDLGTKESQKVAKRGKPVWLDDHTLIIDDYRRLVAK